VRADRRSGQYAVGVARKTPQRTQRERSEATTGELISAARELFAADGYHATLLDDVVDRAGVTKGALYHHFGGKRELFEAVLDQEQRRLALIGAEAYARKRDPWEGFYEGCAAFFEACLDPGVQRIALLDGPAVLGWTRLREIEDRHTIANLRLGLQGAIDDGIIAPRPLEPLVQLLNGAVCEAAMFVARSEDQRTATRQVLAELRVMLDALSKPPVGSRRRATSRR
jgi:AcrR family transcriptional regulator